MKLSDIVRVANYQDQNWVTLDSPITEFDVVEGVFVADGDEFTTNETARTQILQRLGIVGTAKEFADDPLFLQTAVDRKIDTSNRTTDRILYDVNNHQCKSVKSIRYTRIPNTEVLHRLSPYEDNVDESSYIHDNAMVINVSNVNQVTLDNSRGDIIGFGVQAWNSETGMRSLGVGQYMLRLLCTNGMTGRETMTMQSMRHSERDLMVRLTIGIDSIIKNTSRMIGILNKSVISHPILPQLASIDENETSEKWGKFLSRFGINKSHHLGIMKSHLEEPLGLSDGGVNSWGIYNAITRYTSHEFKSSPAYNPDTHMELLQYAYPILTVF